MSDAFRYARIDPDQPHIFGYTVGGLVVIDCRLKFRGRRSTWGVMASAAEHSHCHFWVQSGQIPSVGPVMLLHVKIVDRREEGKPTWEPADAKLRANSGGGKVDALFPTVYVDDYLLDRVQQSDDDRTAPIVSDSLASDLVRLLRSGEEGVTSIRTPKKSTDRHISIDLLGFTVNSHTLRTLSTHTPYEFLICIEKTEAIKRLLYSTNDPREGGTP